MKYSNNLCHIELRNWWSKCQVQVDLYGTFTTPSLYETLELHVMGAGILFWGLRHYVQQQHCFLSFRCGALIHTTSVHPLQ